MKKIRKVFGDFVLKLNYIGRLTVFFIMIVTTVDVVLRKFTSYSVLGSYELTEYSMVIMVFIGIASYQVKSGHIRVDFVLNRIHGRVKSIIEAAAFLIETVIAVIMVCASWKAMVDIYNRGTSSGILHIVQWPFYLIMTLGLILFAVLLFMDAVIKIGEAIDPVQEELSGSSDQG